MPDEPEVTRAQVLGDAVHGFLGRRGGLSTGLFAGLNCGPGSGDDVAAIAGNRARAAEAVRPGARLLTCHQVHSARCVVVTDPWGEGERPQADAMATDRPGLLLGVLTADCAPVLLADNAAGVIGAAHAGWKGAFGGVIENTVAAMEALGADRSDMAAAIGPCIAASSYEVDAAFRRRFLDADRRNAGFFGPGKPGHAWFDLEAYVAHRLTEAGIARVERLGLDTYPAPERFYSFRRATHRGEPAYGRQISVIGLNE